MQGKKMMNSIGGNRGCRAEERSYKGFHKEKRLTKNTAGIELPK